MPNLVDNVISITGSRLDIAHFLHHRFTIWEPGDDPELDFERIIPLPSEDVCALPYWGTRKNSLGTAFMDKRSDLLRLWISTASNAPDPVYLKLGELYPSLQFHIMAADPGNGWAVIIRIKGKDAAFEDADFRMVYEEMLGEPLPNFEAEED
jgi:hypothetical protein